MKILRRMRNEIRHDVNQADRSGARGLRRLRRRRNRTSTATTPGTRY